MDAPVTPVTSGKPRSRIHIQNFVAVEGPNEIRMVRILMPPGTRPLHPLSIDPVS